MTFGTCMSCIEVLVFFVVGGLNEASAEGVSVVGRRPFTNNDDWDSEFASAKRRFAIGEQMVIIMICIIGTVMFFLLCYHCCRRGQLLANPGVVVHGAPAGSIIPQERSPPLPSQPPAAGFIPSPYEPPYRPQTSPYPAPYPTAYSPSVNMFDQPSAPPPASPPPSYSQAIASPFFEPEKRPS